MSHARETTLTFIIINLSPLKPKSYAGHNSHTVWESLIIFDRDTYVRSSRIISCKKDNCFIIAPACSRVRYRRPIFCPSVRQSVRQSVRLSTFMSTFDIYVKVSILINYKTKQPSNLAWNISLTSWLCNIGVCFSVCLSIRPSVCQHLCRSSTFMSKLVF